MENKDVKALIITGFGLNCERETQAAFNMVGATAEQVHLNDLIAGKRSLKEFHILAFIGGFAFGDHLGAGTIFANRVNFKLHEQLQQFIADGKLIIGICNGFQALIKLGLVPYGEICGQKENSPTLTFNTIGRHISKMVYTKVVSNKSPWLQKAQLGGVYCNPASHGEGRFVANDEWLAKLFANGQVATQYVTPNGNLSADEEWNVNGSYMNIEGITSPDGRILGKMAHSERRGDGVAVNIYGEQDIKIFESGVEYFK